MEQEQAREGRPEPVLKLNRKQRRLLAKKFGFFKKEYRKKFGFASQNEKTESGS